MINKSTLNTAFVNLANEIKLTEKNYENMKATARRFVDAARSHVKQKYGIGTSHEYLGSTALKLGVKYKDNEFDVDSALIFNTNDKKILVEIKKDLVDLFRKIANTDYENATAKSKKPVIEISFKDKHGTDKFHLDFLIVGNTNESEDYYFIFSETPNEYNDSYELFQTEFKKFNEWVIERYTNIPETKDAIRLLKYWNSNVNQNTGKFVKLPSSLIVEIASEVSTSNIFDTMIATLERIKKYLTEGYSGNFKPKWDYFRKMSSEDKEVAKNNIESALKTLRSSLHESSVEEAIKLLKKIFQGIETPKETVSTAVAGRKAG